MPRRKEFTLQPRDFDAAELQALKDLKDALISKANARRGISKPNASPVDRETARRVFVNSVKKHTEAQRALDEILLAGVVD